MEMFKDLIDLFTNRFSKKYLLLICAVLSITLIFVGTWFCFSDREKMAEQKETLFISDSKSALVEQEEKKEAQVIMVDVKGDVSKPGLYLCPSDASIQEAIQQAGGITEKGDVNSVNLSQRLTDEMVIYIPTLNEAKTLKESPFISQTVSDDMISLNHATVTELETLPGIGPKKAQSIVAYREQNGGFQSIEELKRVDGIGEKTFEQLKSSVRL